MLGRYQDVLLVLVDNEYDFLVIMTCSFLCGSYTTTQGQSSNFSAD